MTTKYDTILICKEVITESIDDRIYTGANFGKTTGPTQYVGYVDPKLTATNSFGRMISNDLNNWKKGYSAKVSDFNKWIVVDVTHHNHITGRSASKTFLIVFDGGPNGTDKGGGMVLSTASKWRTISGYAQATSYIKAASSALESVTNQKI